MSSELVVVTGGSRGIGAAIAIELARGGYRIAIGCRHPEEAADVVSAILQEGSEAIAMPLDVTSEDGIQRFLADAQARFGALHALVNNAGITGPLGAFAELDAVWMRRVVEVNLTGTMLCAQAALRCFGTAGAKGRSIVNISSIAAQTGSPGEYVHYAASKAAVEAFTLGLAREVAALGIRVNAVAPGTVNTGIHALAGDPSRPARVAMRVPMGRVGEPQEIASAVGWLLSDAASYCTGTVLRVSGGL
ncbi:SDR family oxidoreductase [Roseococcus sp. SYP-B2431]|uniref:SDR family NAD(P)-dependent oxidoreductase n=1 Tax=Roseococcus sp. SYP-B2431 TaxID=2496640 RepID=UPI00104039DE|nr:SDR family oxidoreductase [Roseococcus sp. SYP-B2431]TCH98350.1 SDR family oxidoreductase [Roseococcus sp. SYP-B2431]